MTLPNDYVALSASEKLGLLWERVSAHPYGSNPPGDDIPGLIGRRHLFSVKYNRLSFEHISDEMPRGRTKIIHAHGTTGKARIDVEDSHGFTGIFADGGEGLIRFSDASGGPMLTPSFALKVPVDGKPSMNTFGLPAERRRGRDRDFFTVPFANSTPAPVRRDAKIVGSRFQKTADALGGKRLYSIYLPLHQLAEMRIDGSTVSEPKVPDRFVMTITNEARELYDANVEWRQGMEAFETGLRLFDIDIAESIDAPPKRLGTLTLTSPLVASRYGDETLFFQHDVGPT